MAKFEKRFWTPDPELSIGIGIPRRDRQGGPYFAYMPDVLTGRLTKIASLK
jgi:hypothetical protein